MPVPDESFGEKNASILHEVAAVLDNVDQEQAQAFCAALAPDRGIFLAGAGRSGLVANAFAMRLLHLGGTVHLPGSVLAPPIRRGDLLVIVSGSGETRSLVAMAEKAKEQGASLALVTANPASSLGRLADCLVHLPAPTPKAPGAPSMTSRQPMGSLFEQVAFIFFETMVLVLMQRSGQDSQKMFQRHANLE